MVKKSGNSVNQRDIAERAGVTQMTVSLALRGAAGVSPETVARIRALAEEMGYAPNPLVSSLMRTRRGRGKEETGLPIAWHGATSALRRRDRGRPDMCDTYAEMLAGARAACRRNGFNLEIFQHWDSHGDLARLLHARGIRGMILGPMGANETRDLSMDDMKALPMVSLGREAHEAPYDRVVSNAFDEMHVCVNALVKSGCKRIGYIDLPEHEASSGGRWKAAFHTAAESVGAEACQSECGSVSKSSAAAWLEDYIKTNQPEGLVVGSRTLIGNVVQLVKSGEKIAFVCLERNAWPDWISGVETNFHQIGDDAAQLLIDRILAPYAGEKTHRTIAVHSRWHEGTSHRMPK